MKEQGNVEGSLALNTPRVVVIPADTPEQARKLRVAAYARVSSNSEDQMNSFAAQNAHYTELITSNPEWNLWTSMQIRVSQVPQPRKETISKGS